MLVCALSVSVLGLALSGCAAVSQNADGGPEGLLEDMRDGCADEGEPEVHFHFALAEGGEAYCGTAEIETYREQSETVETLECTCTDGYMDCAIGAESRALTEYTVCVQGFQDVVLEARPGGGCAIPNEMIELVATGPTNSILRCPDGC